MSRDIPIRGRLRLDQDGYRELKIKILERDGWKCQYCGRREQLEIHHLMHRSHSGANCEKNLIVLCSSCHRSLHLGSISNLFYDVVWSRK